MKDRDDTKVELKLKRMIDGLFLSAMFVFGSLGGNHVVWGAVGEAQEIIPDADTVLLDHCNGTTAGTAFGPLGFDTSLPGLGDACQLGPGIYVQYSFPAWYPSAGPGSNIATQGTIEMWIKAEQGGDLLNFNWNNTTAYPAAGHILHFRIDPQAGDVFSYGTWNFERCCLPSGITGTSFVPGGEWVHLAVSWSPTLSKIYINGTEEASINANVYPAIASTVYAYLGYWGGAGGTTGAGVFTGLIDEVHISRVQRSDEEILAHAMLDGENPTEVEIDVKPGSDPNCFNNNGNGVIPVAILTTDTFDAATVDPFTVTLDGAGVRVKGKSGNAGALEDVDGDGDLDLVVQIEDQDGTYEEGDSIATLNGETFLGEPIEGTDSICIVP